MVIGTRQALTRKRAKGWSKPCLKGILQNQLEMRYDMLRDVRVKADQLVDKRERDDECLLFGSRQIEHALDSL